MVSRRDLLHLFILTLSIYPLSVMSLCRPTFAFIAWKLIQDKTSRPPDCPANAWNRCRLCLTRNWKRGLHFSSSELLATFLLPHPPHLEKTICRDVPRTKKTKLIWPAPPSPQPPYPALCFETATPPSLFPSRLLLPQPLPVTIQLPPHLAFF